MPVGATGFTNPASPENPHLVNFPRHGNVRDVAPETLEGDSLMTNATTLTSAHMAETKKVLTQQKVSLGDVLRAIQRDAEAENPTPPKFTLPTKVEPTDLQSQRIKALPAILDEIKFPSVRRQLNGQEKRKILRWTEDIKDVQKVLEHAVDQLKATFFNHADVLAEEKGWAVPGKTPRDKHGWYLLDDREVAGVVEGAPMKLTREFRNGSVTMPLDSIDKLIESGVLTAEDRAKCVKTVEVVDEEGLMKILADRPHLIPAVVAKAKQSSTPSVSFQVRQNK